jgi:hypothetical protein
LPGFPATVIQWAAITGVFGLLMQVPWPEP